MANITSKTVQKIIELRKQGKYLYEIADLTGVSKSTVQYYLRQANVKIVRETAFHRFPNIYKWMEDNHVSQNGLAERAGVRQSNMTLWLTGVTDPSFDSIRKLLNATGLTFEEAFEEANEEE